MSGDIFQLSQFQITQFFSHYPISSHWGFSRSPTYQKIISVEKNIGYIFAVQHGARFIWDTDDDNTLRNPRSLTQIVGYLLSGLSVPTANHEHHLANPYKCFNPIHPDTARYPDSPWPRGFPLQYVRDTSSGVAAQIKEMTPHSEIGIYQSLANKDPDVDAIFRLTQPIPLSFTPSSTPIWSLPSSRYASFNAQATLWPYNAFVSLLLHITVHGRVSDIWRSYIAQRIFSDLGLKVALMEPIVRQVRNFHSLIGYLQSEIPLYTQTDELIKWIMAWKPTGKKENENSKESVGWLLEALYVSLYEIGVLDLNDVHFLQAWLHDHYTVGYEYPSIKNILNTTSYATYPRAPDTSSRSRIAVFFCEHCPGPRAYRKASSELLMHINETILQVVEATRSPFSEVSVILVAQRNVCRAISNEMTYVQYVAPHKPSHDGMKNCVNNIQNREGSSGKHFDWCVALESQAVITQLPKFEVFVEEEKHPTLWVSSAPPSGRQSRKKVYVSRIEVACVVFDKEERLSLKSHIGNMNKTFSSHAQLLSC